VAPVARKKTTIETYMRSGFTVTRDRKWHFINVEKASSFIRLISIIDWPLYICCK